MLTPRRAQTPTLRTARSDVVDAAGAAAERARAVKAAEAGWQAAADLARNNDCHLSDAGPRSERRMNHFHYQSQTPVHVQCMQWLPMLCARCMMQACSRQPVQCGDADVR
jgi:hypothetical protein